MKKNNIFAGFSTFLILLGVLFVGVFLGNNFQIFEKTEEGGDVIEKEDEEDKEEYEPVLDHEKAVISVVEKNAPAVVNIVSSKYVEYQISPFNDFFFFPEIEGNGREEKRLERGEGTGFLISSDGFILTNKHVVDDSEAEYTVYLPNGEKFNAQVVAKDPMQDLAVVKIKGEDFPFVEIGDSDSVRSGQTAVAIGNALGEFQNTVSVGVISGIGRRVLASGGRRAEVLEDVIQTDAAINLGNSGGPLLNLQGEVIGVNTATAVYAEGIGFAIPINRAKRAIKGSLEDGKIVYPFLGIRYLLIDEDVKKEKELSVDYGALIVSGGLEEPAVTPGSAAEKAGLQEGDIILELNGEKITLKNSLAQVITKYNPRDEVKLKVLRNGEKIEKRATLGEIEEE